jgi:hypothetical protein
VISDLLGLSGRRILQAIAAGESDPQRLASLGDHHLRCTQEQLIDALSGTPQSLHRQLLALYLERYQLIQQQIEQLNQMTAAAMQAHSEAVTRLAEVPGFGADSAQQVIAEVGVEAATFASATQLSSWVGTCPGQHQSAEQNHSSHSAKGNRYLRRILNQAAHAAVKKNGSHFQAVFRRLLPRSVIKAPSGRLPTACAVWSGRFCTSAYASSRPALNPRHEPNANALSDCFALSVGWATRSPSTPYPPEHSERIFDRAESKGISRAPKRCR